MNVDDALHTLARDSAAPVDLARLALQLACDEYEVTPLDLQPATNGVIMVRMLTNLKGCYLRVAEFRKAARVILRIIQAAPDDWIQHRDLGASWLQAGEPGKAIDPLQMYLDQMPDAIDRIAVKKLIRKARKELAKWN